MNTQTASDNKFEPIEDFSHCHEGICKRLEMLGQLPALLEPANRAREIAEQSLEFFSEAIFEHHLDEERELFPAVLQSAEAGEEYDKVLAISQQLIAEHRELEETWRHLESGLKQVAKGRPSSIDPLEVKKLVDRYCAHAQFEETEFLPLSQAILGRNSRHMAALGLAIHMRHAPKKPMTFI